MQAFSQEKEWGHLEVAHFFWQRHLRPGDSVVDATCGNGHDTLFLANLLAQGGVFAGKLWVYDIQDIALQRAQERLPASWSANIEWINACHSKLGSRGEANLRLVVYNLGYLPGGDKEVTTLWPTTFLSLQAAMQHLLPGGALSLTCYPGHNQGQVEEEELLRLLPSLDPQQWRVWHYRCLNKVRSPSFIWLQKRGEEKV
jgi:hypothetical protein